MDKDTILSGVHIGEHSFCTDNIINEIKERCIDCGHNFVAIRPPSNQEIPQEYFLQWAKYMAEHQVYFVFLYTIQHAPAGRQSHLDADTVAQMKQIAGKYYVGDMLGETGSSFACKWKGYYMGYISRHFDTMEEAHQGYLDYVKDMVALDQSLGVPAIVSGEATGLSKYNAEAGIEIPMLELMCGHPEILVSSLRGTARATDAKLWGTYLAHEWYGGMRHEDILKRKRLSLAYKYAYLSGSQLFCLESGDEKISAYGYQLDKDSDVCREYRTELENLTRYIQEDARPVGGPVVKVAFVQGNHDAWGGWGGSSLWNQHDRPEWGHSEAEYSWRILEELNTKRAWCDIHNYGDIDCSAAPACGMYDIVPVEAPLSALMRYDYLVFMGWNSMTDSIYDKLLAYVENGGTLLMSAAHLNYTTRRDGEKRYISNEKMEKLFGCRFTGKTVLSNDGVKFAVESLSGLLYPGTKDKKCDPLFSAGFASYLVCEPAGCCVVGERQNDFLNTPMDMPIVVENKVGKGVAILVTGENYPGHPALMPLYRAIVREIISQSARKSKVRVIAGGALRYAVYPDGKLYLLNTDYDLPIVVKILQEEKELTVTLESLELKSLML